MPLAKALRLIAQKASTGLYYNSKLVSGKKVTVHIKNMPLSKALQKVLEGTSLKAVTSGRNITLRKKEISSINLMMVKLKKAAKQETVIGTVTDAQTGDPLVGVNILVVGTSSGTATDNKGQYSLQVKSLKDTLRFSYIGYQTKTVPIDGRTMVDVTLNSAVVAGNELVVVGYGKQKKSDLTGSVSTVKMVKAEAIPTTNVEEMLRGRVPGLKVTEVDPRPGGTSNILIRGRRSILGGNAPLFVVDGVPVDNINNINAEDIASIEVLKDASSEAIYGARGSNGVILVTTKRGEEGKIKVNYHGYYTIQKLTKNFDLYSPEGFAQLRREARRATHFIKTGHDEYLADSTIFSPFELESLAKHRFVNWQQLIMKNAMLTSHDLSMSGGTDKTKFYSSVRYFDQKGIIPTSGYNRGSFRFNLDQKISSKINVHADVSLMSGTQNIESKSLGFITISPLAKPFNNDGTLNEYPLGPASRTINPLWNIQNSKNQNKTRRFHINLVGKYDILKNLTYTLKTSLGRTGTDHGIYLTSKHSSGQNTNGKATITDGRGGEYLIDNILDYKFNIGTNNEFKITALQEASQTKNISTQTIGTDFSTDALGYNGLSGALNTQATRTGFRRRILSFMGRLRYSLYNRYLFTFTGRSDGSSVFAANKKRGFFPSAAFAWKMGQENFLKNINSIDQLKLRFSYGSVGNEAIDPYQTLGITNNFPYVFGGKTAAGYMPGNRLPNPHLTWETSTTFNTGLDFSLFQDRLSGTVEYYNTHTRDLLVDISLPGNTGYSSTITNGGESKNSGIDATVTGVIIRNKSLNWSVTANIAANKNEILKTGLVDQNGNPKDDIARNRFVGHPINVLYEKKYNGLFQNEKQIKNSAQKDQPNIIPGDIRVIDKNHDGQITEDDNFIINTAPNWFGSISTRLNYKGFDLMADIYVVAGAVKLNPYLSVYEDGGTLQGILNGIKVDYWTPEHHTKKYPRPQSATQSYLTSLAVQNASYVRLRTLTLGYTLPISIVQKINMQKLRVYITATNPITITKYKSWSPEVNPNSFPDAKAITFGLDIGF
jgi:TonB-linked SusC/RagA family outer membrane protein